MASLGFFSTKSSAAGCQQPKEMPTTLHASLVGPEHPVGHQDESSDDESLVLVLSPEESLEVPAPQAPAHAGETGTESGPHSHTTLGDDWEEVCDPTHLTHKYPPKTADPPSSTCRASAPDAWVELSELDPMTSGTPFNGPADLRDPTYLATWPKDHEDCPVDDGVGLMSSGVLFGSVKELRDPSALRKIAIALTRAAAQPDFTRAQR
ncbi:hypothetical protein RB601_003059 [Gaeumannomyces tritici]